MPVPGQMPMPPQGPPQGPPPGPGPGPGPGAPMPQDQGQGMPGGEGDIKTQIDQIVSQMPPEKMQQIVGMDQKSALKMLMDIFLQVGLDKPLSLDLAGVLYEAILTKAQQSTNSTLSMMNPNFTKTMSQQNPEAEQGPKQPLLPTLGG